nr:f-box protein cpr30 [Quercus suber]
MSHLHIPVELITNILSHLPVKPLVRFLCVSNQWYAVITNSDFIIMHLNRSIETNRERTLILKEDDIPPPLRYFSVKFPKDNRLGKAVEIYQPLYYWDLKDQRHKWDILDYCHGLVCLYKDDDEILIWNPLIRKYRKLPNEPIEESSGFSGNMYSSLAFGHDHHNNDYKVLRVMTDYVKFEVKVYSLRSQSWKKIEERWSNKSLDSWNAKSLNGAVHWLVVDRGVLDQESLLAFDLATEKFLLYTMPFPLNIYYSDRHLEVLGGCICVIEIYMFTNDVWLMKEYGVESSWTRIYRIEQGVVPWIFEYLKPLMFSKNGKKVLLEEDQDAHTNLMWYDIEKKRCKMVKNRSFPDSFIVATCIGSLLLLDGDNVIDPGLKKKKRKRKRNQSPLESIGSNG